MRVLVVGAGILGLSTCWALVRAGHRPVLIERGPIPDPRASSFDHHRAIRVTYGAEHGYAIMALEAFAAWERLWADLGARHLVETGQLVMGPPEEPWIARSLASLDRLGLPFEALDRATLARRFPHIRIASDHRAWFVAKAGALLAERICTDLARWLRAQKVELVERAPVVELLAERPAVRLGDGRLFEGDALLVAAGAWTTRLVPALADRLQPSRQTVVYVRPPAEFEAAWRHGPVLTHKDGRSGLLFYALPAVDGIAAKLGDHQFTKGGDPDADRVPRPEEVAAILALARSTLAEADRYEILEPRTCFYTVTEDERFVAEPIGRALVVSACSGHGFKFGALLGERTAAALTGALDLEAYRGWIEGRAVA
ncbi:MAG: FAD-dependent oxidoreductase [Geminicoccaceae bacterium]|nr:FAD-dependent oxidoreductase [Geminicoccaceae bacterium]